MEATLPTRRDPADSRHAAARIRPARPDDCDAVADLVRALARDTGADIVPKATGDELRANLFGPAPLLRLLVAEAPDGALAGYCLTLLLFSTWRDARGLHVIDLYVVPERRSAQLGQRLLARAATDGLAEGARFMRLEVERGNARTEAFYEGLGFKRKDNEVQYSLDPTPMTALAAMKDTP